MTPERLEKMRGLAGLDFPEEAVAELFDHISALEDRLIKTADTSLGWERRALEYRAEREEQRDRVEQTKAKLSQAEARAAEWERVNNERCNLIRQMAERVDPRCVPDEWGLRDGILALEDRLSKATEELAKEKALQLAMSKRGDDFWELKTKAETERDEALARVKELEAALLGLRTEEDCWVSCNKFPGPWNGKHEPECEAARSALTPSSTTQEGEK